MLTLWVDYLKAFTEHIAEPRIRDRRNDRDAEVETCRKHVRLPSMDDEDFVEVDVLPIPPGCADRPAPATARSPRRGSGIDGRRRGTQSTARAPRGSRRRTWVACVGG